MSIREAVIQKIIDKRLIAIVRGVERDNILPLAKALYAGGIEMIEVTFNQSASDKNSVIESISLLRDKMDGLILAGAGTVITPEQVDLAAEAGASYIVSPNTDKSVIKRTRELGLVSIPGAMTPTEACIAHSAGADFVKLFPAANLGSGYIKDLCAPLNHIRFLAVGGINENNASEFMKAGAVGLGIGGNLANKDWLKANDFDKITAVAANLSKAAGNL